MNVRSRGYERADCTAPSSAVKGLYECRAHTREKAALASSDFAIESSTRPSARVDVGKSGSPLSSKGFVS